MPSQAINEVTRREWRELGFYYERDDEAKEWLIVGTKQGLARFASQLRRFASDPKNDSPSEHEHFGPYMYLEVGTWHQAEITDHWIAGPVKDLLRLAALIDKRVQESMVGQRIALRSEFSPTSPYEIALEIRDDGFDPALADSACW